jgi:YfiH family protein
LTRHQLNGLVFYTFDGLDQQGVSHGIFTRLGGFSSPPFQGLNVGHLVGDDVAVVEANQRAIYQTLGLSPEDIVTARQVHGASVALAGAEYRGKIMPNTDALMTGVKGLTLMLRFADCVPIFLYDHAKGAIALGHGGWRGIVARIAHHMLEAMKNAFGSQPENILACLGPAIGPCCYQVGEEVAKAVEEAFPRVESLLIERNRSIYLDLWEATRWQLAAAGVERIEIGKICTACHTQEFFSNRTEGRTGRFAALMGLKNAT